MDAAAPRVEAVPYHADAGGFHARLRALSWPVWLDSGHPAARGGRFDILSADPYATLTADAATATCRLAGEATVGDPWQLLRECLGPRCVPPADLPFCGGALGFVGYDAGRPAAGLAPRSDAGAWPDLAIGVYDWALVVDHAERRSHLVRAGRDPRGEAGWRAVRQCLAAAPEPLSAGPPLRGRLVEHGIGLDAYTDAFSRIQRYIRDGDSYQVNFAQRFRAEVDSDAWTNYRALRRGSPAPHAALLEYPFGAVLSASPERFLQLRGRRVTTRPIKGTRPRAGAPARDRALRAELRASAKDRAENLMIVDLLRNDLGKVCEPGSIGVPELFRVESFAAVHHLVSTVVGLLRPECDAVDLLQACFPGGSVTGAPKRRSMQIIDELERHPRQVYCGSVIRLGFDGDLDSSIAIRTALQRGNDLFYWAGGGIVADSDCADEYQESLDKSAGFLRLFG